MLSILQQEWRAIKDGRPGRRFHRRYIVAKKARRAGGGRHHALRVLRFMIAAVALVVGFVLMFIPGPAVVFFFLAGGLLATESRLIARLLDWMELKGRALAKKAQRHWNNLPRWGRSVLVGFGACISVASAYLSYRLMTR